MDWLGIGSRPTNNKTRRHTTHVRFKILGIGVVFRRRLFNKLHIHIFEVLIHFRVVNEFIGNVDAFVGKVFHRFVGQGDASFDPPAKAKILNRYKQTNKQGVSAHM